MTRVDRRADITAAVKPQRPLAFLQLPGRRLEQLNEIAGRVYQQDLRSSGSGHDIVSELHAGGTQSRHFRGKIVDDEVNAIPAAGSWPIAVGHRSPGRACRPAEQ
jgi:hypothetical protein